MKKPREHQLQGAVFLSQRKGAYLNWEPRVGKTLTAVLAAQVAQAKTVLVLCPASVKSVWAREFEAQGYPQGNINVLFGTAARVKDFTQSEGVNIANYDLISPAKSGVLDQLLRLRWDVVILDEAHMLRNGSRRDKAVFGARRDGSAGIVAKARQVWCLSGTPAPNHYGELYGPVRSLASDKIRKEDGKPMTRIEFEDTFCRVLTTVWGRQVSSDKNKGRELATRLKGFMHNLKMRDIAKDLPPLQWDMLDLAWDKKLSKDLLSKFLRIEDELSKTDVDEAVSKAGTHVATERLIWGMCKADLLGDVLKEQFGDDSRKFVVFGHHKAVLDHLFSYLHSEGFYPVMVRGDTPPGLRDKHIDTFQTDRKCRAFVGQLTAAGTGIDLSVASDVFIVEPSWVPAENLQAAARVVNMNKLDGAVARIVSLSGSLDDRIMRVVRDKTEALQELWGK
jgi:SWI/SNF-related matrix-associated actin-dependent regulator of chromatin subfamily A-like protein 1